MHVQGPMGSYLQRNCTAIIASGGDMARYGAHLTLWVLLVT